MEGIDLAILRAHDLRALARCIAGGANPDLLGGAEGTGLEGFNPLSCSLRLLAFAQDKHTSKKMVEMLLDAGANPNKSSKLKLASENHMTPLMMHILYQATCQMNSAPPYDVLNQSTGVMQLLLCLGADPQPMRDALSGRLGLLLYVPAKIAMDSDRVRDLFTRHNDYSDAPHYRVKHLTPLADRFPQQWWQLKGELRPMDTYTYLHSPESLEHPQVWIDDLRFLHKWSTSDPMSFPDEFRNMVLYLEFFGRNHQLLAAITVGVTILDLVCDHLPLTMCSHCLHDHQEGSTVKRKRV